MGGSRDLPTTSRIVLSQPTNPRSQNRKQPIGPLNPPLRPTLLELPIQEPPMPDLGNAQNDGKWTPDCPLADPTSRDNISGCTSAVSLLL